MKLILAAKRAEAADVTSFVFRSEAPIKWQAGQFLHYSLPHQGADERGITRYFMIASAPFEGHVMLTTRSGPESFVETGGDMLGYRTSSEYRGLTDGERLRRRFETAGFGDFFYAPDARDWQNLRRGELPDLAGPPARRLAADTHMSLLADGDFVNQQDAIGAMLIQHGSGVLGETA